MEFPTLGLKFPEIIDIDELEPAKKFFRLANTQFKKALAHYILDGYVTEHCRI